jgi:carbon starvation protein CstA
MITFFISLLILLAAYFIYGRTVEKIFGIDAARTTPAITKQDGVDYVPLPTWRGIFQGQAIFRALHHLRAFALRPDDVIKMKS